MASNQNFFIEIVFGQFDDERTLNPPQPNGMVEAGDAIPKLKVNRMRVLE